MDEIKEISEEQALKIINGQAQAESFCYYIIQDNWYI